MRHSGVPRNSAASAAAWATTSASGSALLTSSDAAMTIAVAALYADGPSTLRNIASWRVKETDRLAAMATELRKIGATVEEGADYLRVTPPAELSPATIDTYDDHRMAMSFSLAGLRESGFRINDPACVNKTYPNFFTDFARVTGIGT